MDQRDTYSDGAAGTCTRRQLIDAARKYDGVRFRHQGRTVDGLDCAGLLVVTGWDCGLNSWSRESHFGYERLPDGVTVNKIMACVTDKVPVCAANLIPGNIAQISYVSGGIERVTHMGFLTDMGGDYDRGQPYQLGMIHAYLPARKVVEHRLDEGWFEQVKGVFRPRGLVD